MPWDPPRIRIERATIGSEIAERLGVHPIPFESDRFNRFEIGEGALLVRAPLRDPGSLITLLWIAKGFVDRIPNLVRRTYGGMDAPIPQGFPISWPETGG